MVRFHETVLNEFYQKAFRKKICKTLEELQTDLDIFIKHYNEEQPHGRRNCDGKTPMNTFNKTKYLAEDKTIGYNLTVNM
ncbi:MAG: transposase [Melioribacteraceae bacterium]|nr:transposase [Melioribacteraceae bacterium]